MVLINNHWLLSNKKVLLIVKYLFYLVYSFFDINSCKHGMKFVKLY